jgi:hypothetical protein
MDRTIPVASAPTNLLLSGPNSSLANSSLPAHPVANAHGEEIDYDRIRRAYGSAMAMRLQAERSYAMQCGGR